MILFSVAADRNAAIATEWGHQAGWPGEGRFRRGVKYSGNLAIANFLCFFIRSHPIALVELLFQLQTMYRVFLPMWWYSRVWTFSISSSRHICASASGYAQSNWPFAMESSYLVITIINSLSHCRPVSTFLRRFSRSSWPPFRRHTLLPRRTMISSWVGIGKELWSGGTEMS